MNFPHLPSLCFLLLLIGISCTNAPQKDKTPTHTATTKGSYAYDAAFLKNHTSSIIELSNPDGTAKVLLSPQYQGRVMTSTATGDTGVSFGWLNYDLMASGQKKKAFNPVGGEERFWLGPEGGQYSLYFKSGDSFTIAHWQVPAIIDTVSYDVVRSNATEAVFSKKASLTNYSGNSFDIQIERRIRLLDKQTIEGKLNVTLPTDVQLVGYESESRLQNLGTRDWTPDKGLLSIWLLGMFTPTPKTIVMIPFSPVPNVRSYITDNYFGTIPPDRLQVKDSVLFFVCDGKYRSKIGLSPVIVKSMAAGFDFQKNVLTLVLPSIDKNAPYVNSKWEIQKDPYKGDVINSYNDGPLEDGTQMGPFYEIESSSPALALRKGETGTYRQTTCHLQGNYASLRQVAKQLLGVDMEDVKKMLK
ncbi:MAG: hypothetical protein M3342_21545 [Bacteroidota bacterium]|nr:hypothetical protein [Bacteroidota bacterium]